MMFSPPMSVAGRGARCPAGWALVPVVLLAACSSGETGSATDRPTAGAVVADPSADALPEDGPAATDAPRPPGTDVMVSFAGWDDTSATVQVAGYVSPVVETGGTCTVELQQDDRVVTVSVPAEADATTTVCGGLAVGQDELGEGAWTVVLRYVSATTSGVSEPVAVQVPA